MLRLAGGQVESLFDELLPVEVRELPADLAVLDRLLADRLLLAPIEGMWEPSARRHGRPTIPMASFVRLMIVKQRTGWGYETLLREVSDSLHLRRFCLIALTERVPDESTVRKLVRRLGPEVVADLTRVVIGKACRRAAQRLEELAGRCQRVVTQIQQRSRGEKISDRLVSLSDPDARPIRKGKLGKPNEFGYVVQLAEVTANTRRGARGYVLPAATAPGNPGENRLLDRTVAELDRLGLAPREVALDGGFAPGPTEQTLTALAPERTFISGRAEPGPRRTRRRLARYRTGCEGRISHLKRGYGLRRSRLRGDQGQRTWTGWAILAYNLDTLAIHTT
jgi:transposase, IS5 family